MERIPRHSLDEVRAAVTSSRSLSEVIRKLGLRPAGGNHRSIRKLVDRYGLSTEHFDPYWSSRRGNAKRREAPLESVLVERSTYKRASLKRRLYEVGLKERSCELCGQGENWRGDQMALILDHINGVGDDNRLDNLRIVCPNCAATLETHCGRSNAIDRKPRSCLRCGLEFLPNRARQRYCSHACGIRHERARTPKPDARKVQRPSYEQLRREVAETSMCAVGRKYGVSDNAVRKWLRAYEQSEALQRIEQRSARAEPSGGTH